jgi:hypothetical protein
VQYGAPTGPPLPAADHGEVALEEDPAAAIQDRSLGRGDSLGVPAAETERPA